MNKEVQNDYDNIENMSDSLMEAPPVKEEKKERHDLSFIVDIPLRIIVQLADIEMSVQEILSLKVGSVIELGKLAGEPMEIILTDKIICKGEVIVVNEHYGIRMTDIVKPDYVQEEEQQL